MRRFRFRASPTRCKSLQLSLIVFTAALWTSCGGGGGGGVSQNFQSTNPPPPQTNLPSIRLSTDPFTNNTSQHQTEVEPDSFAFGNTIVAAFQQGRFFGGGASDIGFATSTDGGGTWTHGVLPGITNIQQVGNPFDRVSDPAVAYDAAHQMWLIASLPILNTTTLTPAVLVSRSSDGITWENPVAVTTPMNNPDKDWIVCDNTNTSPFYGHCYVEWDEFGNNSRITMNTSTDGGLTWGPSLNTADTTSGLGGQPLVQPDGTVIVPINDIDQTHILAFRSADGGSSWSATVMIAAISDHTVAGGLRTSPLPSAEIDAAGTVYVVWQDCRFRAGCSSNDLVMSTSGDGVTWTAPVRIPIDAVSSQVDHFIPGLAVDPSTSGSTAHLALAYYFYSDAACTAATCQLSVGFTSSADGGTSWAAPQNLAGPMTLSWLANTDQGPMVGDYISTSYVNGKAFAVFASANRNTTSGFDEAIFTNTTGLRVAEQRPQSRLAKAIPVKRDPVLSTLSDHPARRRAFPTF